MKANSNDGLVTYHLNGRMGDTPVLTPSHSHPMGAGAQIATKCLAWPLAVLTCLLVSTRLPAGPAGGPVELLVKWREGPTSTEAAAANACLGGVVVRNFHAVGWQQVRLPASMSLADGLEAYRRLESVLNLEPNGPAEVILPEPPRGTPSRKIVEDEPPPYTDPAATPHGQPGLHGPPEPVTPNDPMFGQQWHLRKVDAPTAWATTTGSTNVVVAIIDTGVDYTHPDLAPNMWRNPGETGTDSLGRDKATNQVDDDGNGYVDDVHGIDAMSGSGDPMDTGSFEPGSPTTYHGTVMAGIIGAAGNNARGITGVSGTVRLMAIRAFGGNRADPEYFRANWTALLAAWDYLIAMKRRGVDVRVTSNSYGVRFDLPAVRDAIAIAGREGILSVFAAGNFPVDQDVFAYFPGAWNLTESLNVAASTTSDTLWPSSAFGRGAVDLAAPGVDLVSTEKGGGYVSGFTGTSGASPIVAGAAALLAAIRPEATPDDLKAAMLGSVDQPAFFRGKVTSHGRLNLAQAVTRLQESDPPAIVVQMSPAGQRTPPGSSIEIRFSRPMDRSSVEAAFSAEPRIGGSFQWTDESRGFRFLPQVPLDPTLRYTVRVQGIAMDATGQGLDGDFDGAREGSPADDFIWTFQFPSPNDDFAQAQPLTGPTGEVQGSNRYAYGETGEPAHVLGDYRQFGATVWYRWTTPGDGWYQWPEWYTFDLTQGTDFDSLLAVYSGESIAALTPVAGNDNHGATRSSRLSFPAEPGKTYSVVVAGKHAYDPAEAGTFRLRWYPTPPPGFNGAQVSPVSGAPGARVTLTGTNFTGAAAVLFGDGSAAFANALTNNLDLRITATVPPDATSGPITIVTPHGHATSTATFQVLPPPLAVRGAIEGQVEISWPATSEAFVLESASQLAAAIWEPVSAPLLRADGQSRVLVRGAEAARFYRLRAR